MKLSFLVLAGALLTVGLAGPAQAYLPVLPEVVCVPIYDFPDNGLFVCVDRDGPCYVFLRRETFAGPLDTCLVPPAA